MRYQHVENENLLIEEEKGSRHASEDTKDQLLINEAVIRNFKRRKANLNLFYH